MSEIEMVIDAGNMDIFPGQKVEFYHFIERKFKNGVIVSRYGYKQSSTGWLYPDLVDVRFKKGKKYFISKAHFTYGVRKV